MERVCVVLKTLSCGNEEIFRGAGEYRYEKTRFCLDFQSGDASFEIRFNKTLTIVRKGDVSYELRLSAGKSAECRLDTPYGIISATLRTNGLTTEFSPTRAEIIAEYILTMGGESSVHSMRLTVLPVSVNYTGEKEV